MRHHSLKKTAGIFLALVVGINSFAVAAAAQSDGNKSDGNNHARALRGYSEANRKAQFEWEEKMRAIPKPELLREYMKRLSAEPHHVGSAYGKQNAEYMLRQVSLLGAGRQDRRVRRAVPDAERARA